MSDADLLLIGYGSVQWEEYFFVLFFRSFFSLFLLSCVVAR